MTTDIEVKSNLPTVQDFGEDAGAGMENIDKSERRIPFLSILQSNSPQVKDTDHGGIHGARPGNFLNTATGELFDGRKGIVMVPAFRMHNYVEFAPRHLGGGFVANHAPDSPQVLDLIAKQGRFGRLSTATRWNPDGTSGDGTEFTETFYLFSLFVPEDSPPFEAMLGFKSTQIKKYTGFIERYQRFHYNTAKGVQSPPIWAHRWWVSTAPEKNKKGDYFGLKLRLAEVYDDGSEKAPVASLLAMDHPLYVQAKLLNAMLKSGAAKADYDSQAKADADEEAPF
jgi:hypothetical protein